MPDFILFMHNDASESKTTDDSGAWSLYIAKLQAKGVFQGGSSLGPGMCVNKSDSYKNLSSHLVGYIRINAESLSHAMEFVKGNPVFEAGGTVEIRELLTE